MEVKKIIVAFSEKAELKKLFNTTYPTVRAALNGTYNSDLSKRIRKLAIERGGVEVDPPKVKVL